MHRLITCEFFKLKRKKFIWLVVLAALLFPVPIAVMLMMDTYDSPIGLFNDLFIFIMGYGVQLLLPCVIGVIAAMLFFMERDNDTFKNLRTIPVTSTQMILAKIAVLFIFGIIFCLMSTFASIVLGSMIAEVGGLTDKLILALMMGIFITAGTLPLVILIVFFSKTYIFSILLCIFYSVVSLTVESFFGILPKTVFWSMPIPLTTLWSVTYMIKAGMRPTIENLEYLLPTTWQTVGILALMTCVSIAIIDYLYKKRGDA